MTGREAQTQQMLDALKLKESSFIANENIIENEHSLEVVDVFVNISEVM